MFIRLLLLLVAVPALEVYLLWQVHAVIGLFPTVALVLLTGIAGAYLLRIQGTEILRRLAIEVNAGRLPGNELLDGILVLVGGVLLLTPGFCTDITGFLLLIPATRGFAKQSLLLPYLRRCVARGSIRIYSP